MRQHRPIAITVVAALGAMSAVAGACSRHADPQVEQRRELLKAPDREQEIAAREEKRIVVDPSGKLLASDKVVAGVALPRGLREVLVMGRASAYHSTGIPFEALDKYFGERLFTGKLERPMAGVVRYADAQILNAPKQLPVTVRITRLNHNDDCEILIEQQAPKPPPMTPEQAAAAIARERPNY